MNKYIKLIKELRNKTNVGIVDCKKALIKSKGDIEEAINIMRKEGKINIHKKLKNKAVNGIILIKSNRKLEVIIEINCETDFVSKNIIFIKFCEKVINTIIKKNIYDINILKNIFKNDIEKLVYTFGENIKINRLGVLKDSCMDYYLHDKKIGVLISSYNAPKKILKSIAMHIAASNPRYINVKDVPLDIIEKEKKIQLEILIKNKKDKIFFERIIKGKIKKFIDSIVLSEQNFIFETSKKVKKVLNEYNILIKNFIRFELGES
ncbi:translation elongation factor Ts [Candidatus Annandia pinicola]|uniref:translation elongation factor Ts n=1 Tax=Candidatus Annandia pinicola TaxID=1345117 RepID=UPI001D0137CA|nr:translation elongation factor Ts [Candidatus Annandia pinicola]UDG80449.1 Elongation factor Ts [Candidatus Annandia pinicola]